MHGACSEPVGGDGMKYEKKPQNICKHSCYLLLCAVSVVVARKYISFFVFRFFSVLSCCRAVGDGGGGGGDGVTGMCESLAILNGMIIGQQTNCV